MTHRLFILNIYAKLFQHLTMYNKVIDRTVIVMVGLHLFLTFGLQIRPSAIDLGLTHDTSTQYGEHLS